MKDLFPQFVRRRPTLSSFLFGVCAVLAAFLFFGLLGGAVAADPDGFGRLAEQLYEGHGFGYATPQDGCRGMNGGPLYPLLIAALSALTGGFALWKGDLLACPFSRRHSRLCATDRSKSSPTRTLSPGLRSGGPAPSASLVRSQDVDGDALRLPPHLEHRCDSPVEREEYRRSIHRARDCLCTLRSHQVKHVALSVRPHCLQNGIRS